MATSRISTRLLAGALPGLRQGVQSIGTGGAAYDQGFEQSAALQSKLAQALASTRLANAKADEAEREASYQAPDALRNNAMMANGVPLDAAPDVAAFLQTGKLGAQYDALPPDQAGPALPRPAWEANLSPLARSLAATQTALALGDKNSANVAKATEIGREMSLGDAILRGTQDPMKVAQSQYALKGSAPFHFSEYGVGNNLTGTVDASGAPAQLFARNRQADITATEARAGASRASAASSYASADNSRASAARTRSETERGMKSGDIVVQQGADGTIMLVNKLTGLTRPATTADGNALAGKMAAPKEMTEGQAKDNGYGSRMQEADGVLKRLTGKYSPTAVNAKISADGVGMGAGTVANWMLSAEGQQAEQAQRDFINAILRRESGAAIADTEFANARKQYFPQPNDKPETLKQKERNRQIAIEGVFGSVPKNKRGVPSLTNPVGSPEAMAPAPAPAAAGGWSYLGKE